MHKIFTYIGGALAGSGAYLLSHSDQVGTVANAVATAYPHTAPALTLLGILLAMVGHSAIPNAVSGATVSQ